MPSQPYLCPKCGEPWKLPHRLSSPHDWTSQPLLGQFVADIKHKSEPWLYATASLSSDTPWPPRSCCQLHHLTTWGLWSSRYQMLPSPASIQWPSPASRQRASPSRKPWSPHPWEHNLTLQHKRPQRMWPLRNPWNPLSPATPPQPAALSLKSFLKTPGPCDLNPSLHEVTNPTTAVALDFITLKQAFPHSFDTIGNMPGTCTICIDPSIPHCPTCQMEGTHKVPWPDRVDLRWQGHPWSHHLVTCPTEWVSSLTYPCKPDGSLHVCLDPKGLKKAILQGHYIATTHDEISHWLSSATYFNKLAAKDGFWSIHLNEKSS